MGEVHCRDPRTGVVYVYSSHSYWDKESKTKKAKRKLIGKLDESGNVVPTNGRPGRMKKQPPGDKNAPAPVVPPVPNIALDYESQIRAQEKQIRDLENKVQCLMQEKNTLINSMDQLLSKFRSTIES
ncbi:MAG: hypothetical protein IJ719_12125 [Clostridia bacterium]|nr:hypothetical protein [Clostridia bacterium]